MDRIKTVVFLTVFALGMAIVPVINYRDNKVSASETNEWGIPVGLYNFDFLRPYVSFVLYSCGLSMNPSQAIVGKSGWMFLGNEYDDNIDNRRRSIDDATKTARDVLGVYFATWKSWYGKHGVKDVVFMVAPDKETIYSEYTPNWSRPVGDSPTKLLISHINPEDLLDTTPTEFEAKSRVPWPIYHLTDTHWNHFGAWKAFQSLTLRLSRDRLLDRFKDSDFEVQEAKPWYGGDVSNLLYIRALAAGDREVEVTLKNRTPTNIEQIDFVTGKVLEAGGNPEIGSPIQPLLIRSPNALNKARVLWLRDSFGSGLSPFMAHAFSDVLQLHYEAIARNDIRKVVSRFMPEVVIFTVAERKLRSPAFQVLPHKSP